MRQQRPRVRVTVTTNQLHGGPGGVKIKGCEEVRLHELPASDSWIRRFGSFAHLQGR